MTPDLRLDVLRCPVSGTELRYEDGFLVSRDNSDLRYRVEAGIPLLLPPETQSSKAAEPIIESYRSRAASYFADNYVAGRNPNRYERHERTLRLLEQHVQPGATVLEAGSGPVVLADAIRGLTDDYIALDLSLENMVAGRERIGAFAGVVGTLTSLPLRSGVFDVVLAIGCLEYVPAFEVALRELCRVTKRHGLVIATFANSASPGRQWDERVVFSLRRLKRTFSRESETTYGRYLRNTSSVETAFTRCGARVETMEHYNAGLVGYPLSRARSLARLEKRAATRFPVLGRFASEFLVIASRES